MGQPDVPVTVKTREQIAAEYGFSRQTLWRRLNKHSIKLPRDLISLKSQKIIYETMGYPPGISKEDYENV